MKSPTVIGGIRPPKSGSHQTPRWRKTDSNHRSPARKSRFLLRKANCGTERGQAKKGCFLCGTDGSNPSPSSSESATNSDVVASPGLHPAERGRDGLDVIMCGL